MRSVLSISQVEFMVNAGVPLDAAETAIVPIREEYRFDPSRTHDEIISLSRRLEMPLMNIHRPCDEIGRRILQPVMDNLGRDGTIRELMGRYSDIDEIRKAGEAVELICGSPDACIGKGVVIFSVQNGRVSDDIRMFSRGFYC